MVTAPPNHEGIKHTIENGNPSSRLQNTLSTSTLTLALHVSIAPSPSVFIVSITQPWCHYHLVFPLATIHYSSYDTLDQACPALATLRIHSPQLSGSSSPLSSYGLSLPPLLWALERGSREMKGRRQLSVKFIPHNIQQPQYGVRFFDAILLLKWLAGGTVALILDIISGNYE